MKHQFIIHNSEQKCWMFFENPVRILEAAGVEEVLPCLTEIEEAVQRERLYAAGFISYEAAPAFDSALTVRSGGGFPLLYFGLYTEPKIFDVLPFGSSSLFDLGEMNVSVSKDDYICAIERIKEYIAAGDTYQVNYSIRLNAAFDGNPNALFHKMVLAQYAGYSAYIDTGNYIICSASPELFFQLDGATLTSRPMKGTAARGRTLDEDKIQSDWLYHSQKNRAENIMIVDMVRNDMGRIANIGSVYVESLYDIERYPTLFQMTSTVSSETGASFSEILRALFPCASISGAPKARTMEIIAELETSPRHIYTGTIGYLAPDRQAQFNVAIRTVLIDTVTNAAVYGLGGGIVWDSDSLAEYEECHVKARILKQEIPDFSLLETILWTPGNGYFLLNYHLRRLEQSARYFDYRFDSDEISTKLDEITNEMDGKNSPYKIRLLLARNGSIICEPLSLEDNEYKTDISVGLARKPVDSSNIYLYHKTTHRDVYIEAKSSCPECDDVVLFNERCELTESCIANIIVRINGTLVTPPVESGLLAGTYRAWMLDRNEVLERVIMVDELKNADEIYLANSVRKLQKAVLIDI